MNALRERQHIEREEMKKLIAGILAITIHFSAVAEPGKRESVRELLDLTNADAMIDTIYSQMDQLYAGLGQQITKEMAEEIKARRASTSK